MVAWKYEPWHDLLRGCYWMLAYITNKKCVKSNNEIIFDYITLNSELGKCKYHLYHICQGITLSIKINWSISATEMVGPNKRLFASFCVYFTFCFGSYALLILAYYIRNWENLMWAMSIPIGGYILALL